MQAIFEHKFSFECRKRKDYGQDLTNEDKNQHNLQSSEIWQRWEGEDATLVWKTWGNVFLWTDCEDIIHSFGAYDSHERVKFEDFDTDFSENSKVFELYSSNKQQDNSNIENLDPSKSLIKSEISLSKKEFLGAKCNEYKVSLDQLENLKKEIKIDYENSQLNIKNTFSLIREVINNKEKELSDRLLKNYQLKVSEINELIFEINTETKQFSDISAKVWEIIDEISDETYDQLKRKLEDMQIWVWKAFAYSTSWPDLISLWVIVDGNLNMLPSNTINDWESDNAYVHDLTTKANIDADAEKRNKSGLRNYKGRGLNKGTKEDYSYVSTKSLSRRSSMWSNNDEQNANSSIKKDDKNSQSTQFIENTKVLNTSSNKYLPKKPGSFTNRFNSDTKNKPKSEYT